MTSKNLFDYSLDAVTSQASNIQKSTSEPLASGSKMGRSRLGGGFEPSHYSVICGRGKASFNHVGNRRFRILASMFIERYSKTKTAKSAIVSDIVAMTRQAGGSFCRFEEGVWFEVGDHCARQKVSALFRDLLHTQYRSSTTAKIARRKARRQNKKRKELSDQQLFEGTADHSDDSSMSSACWGSSMGSLGGEQYSLEDDLVFDIDVF
jgi:hypothetical protein